MNVPNILLTAAAVIPAIALLIFVYVKDRAEKEPIGLLLALLAAGMFSVIPAIIGETVLEFLPGLFAFSPLVSAAVEAFVVVALVEEVCKWGLMMLITRNSKHFNSLFDGMIYSIFVSLGFALVENVMYAFQHGMETALLRAVTAVPAHMFFAVMMGYYYSHWNVMRKARAAEQALAAGGSILLRQPLFDSSRPLMLSLAVPVLFHGFYDFCCFVDSTLFSLLFLAFLVFMYVYCFMKLHRLSRQDTADNRVVWGLIANKYPEFAARVYAAAQESPQPSDPTV